MTTPIRLAGASRIEKHVREGTLVQGRYYGEDDQGRDLACLLSAADPGIKTAQDCPYDLMPQWLAGLIPLLFDGIRAERMNDYALRFAEALRRGRMDDAVMHHILVGAVEYALGAAMAVQPSPEPHYWPQVKAACEAVILGLRRNTPWDEKAPALAAAESAEAAADAARAAAASAAAHAAAQAAAEAAQAAAVRMPAESAEAAARAALTAEVAEGAAAKDAARRLAYEHIFDALISAMLDGTDSAGGDAE